MSNPSYTDGFTVTETPERVFAGVTDVRNWWTETIEGDTGQQGDTFVFRDAGIRFARFRLTEVIPGQRVVWTVEDSELVFVDDRDEWTGTKVIFDITTGNGTTTLHFTHDGLLPSVECYEACSTGWSGCMRSLEQLIVTGESQTGPKP